MPTKSTFFRAVLLAGCAAAATLALADSAQAKKSFHTLYTFKGGDDDGANPMAGLIVDRKGNLYGTTLHGPGAGAVFKVGRDGSEVVLHGFDGGKDGAHPDAGVIADAAGNLYGTTYAGGARGCADDGPGCGVVFKLAPDGTETILHAFQPRNDGRHPYAGLVMDGAGNLYGTTAFGAGRRCKTACGTVFKIAPDGTETILHVFGQQGDGAIPLAGLILDKAGNLYGIAGVAFKLAPDGTETILHAFKGGTDGADPVAPLIADPDGNLYGTTMFGGGGACLSGSGCGTVFKIAPDGTETVLYAFKGGDDGFMPQAGLLMDAAGNLLGTTSAGGGTGCDNNTGCGTVFKLAPDGTETVLHAFVKPDKGSVPLGSLVADKSGRLFGTTSRGGADGHGQGIVFKITSY